MADLFSSFGSFTDKFAELFQTDTVCAITRINNLADKIFFQWNLLSKSNDSFISKEQYVRKKRTEPVLWNNEEKKEWQKAEEKI